MTSVELAGITFGDQGPDGWQFTELTDWYGVPASKAPAESIPQAHGAFDPGVDWRESVALTLKGMFIGTSEAAALAAVEQLSSVGTSKAQQTIRVTDALRRTSRQVSVRQIDVPDHHGRKYVKFAIDMIAPDPLRYGDAVTETTGLPSLAGGIVFPIVFPIDFAVTGSPGRIVTANAGTQATYSTFEVSGGLGGGFSLIDIEDGREIRFEFPIEVGHTVFVEPRTGRAWLDNESNNLTGRLTKSEWWAVPAGSSRTIQFAAIGAVTGNPILTAHTPPPYL